MIEVGFEPTPFRTSALSWRLRPLGHLTNFELLPRKASFKLPRYPRSYSNKAAREEQTELSLTLVFAFARSKSTKRSLFVFFCFDFGKCGGSQLVYDLTFEDFVRPLGICAHHADLEFLLLVFHLFLGFQQDFGYFWEGFLDGEIAIVDLFDFSTN